MNIVFGTVLGPLEDLLTRCSSASTRPALTWAWSIIVLTVSCAWPSCR